MFKNIPSSESTDATINRLNTEIAGQKTNLIRYHTSERAQQDKIGELDIEIVNFKQQIETLDTDILKEERENNAYIAALTQVIVSMHAILKLSFDGTPIHTLKIPLILEEHNANFATNKTQIVNVIARFEGDMQKFNLKVERLEGDKKIQATEIIGFKAELATEKALIAKLNIANIVLGQENGNVKNESNVYHEKATKLQETVNELKRNFSIRPQRHSKSYIET